MATEAWLTFLNHNIGKYLRRYRDEPKKWTMAALYARYIWSTLTRSEQEFYGLITRQSPLEIYITEHEPLPGAAEWEARIAWGKLTNEEHWLYMYPEDALK